MFLNHFLGEGPAQRGQFFNTQSISGIKRLVACARSSLLSIEPFSFRSPQLIFLNCFLEGPAQREQFSNTQLISITFFGPLQPVFPIQNSRQASSRKSPHLFSYYFHNNRARATQNIFKIPITSL